MEHKYLHEVLPFLKEANKKRQEQFETYFRSAPLWLMDSLQIETINADIIFIRENEPADTIFFVIKGEVKATDYRVSGIAYDFMKPAALIALGGMEVIMEINEYQSTWQTISECIVVKLARAKYEKWLYSDMEAFRLETKITCASLLEEERRNRLYLFLQGADRLALLLVGWFEKNSKHGMLRIKKSRQELGDETGLCLKSISRTIKKFSDEELVTKQGNQILISQKQYERLKNIVNEKIDGVY